MTEYKVRNKDGHEDTVDEKNIAMAEKDGYSIVVSDGKKEDTVAFKNLAMAKKDGYVPLRNVGALETVARAGGQGFLYGLADEGVAAVKAGFNKVSSLGKSDLTDDYGKYRDEERVANKQSEIANPNLHTGVEIGAGVASTFVPVVGAIGKIPQAVKAATTLGRVGQAALAGAKSGAITGAVTGFGTSEKDTLAGQALDTAIGSGTGTLTGVAGGAGGQLVGEGLSALTKIPKKLVDMYENHFVKGETKRITGADKKAGQFLQDPNKVESVRMYPEDKLVADEVIAGYKERLPEVYRDIAKDIKGLKKEAQKSVDKAYSKMAEETAKDTRPSDPENNTLQAILKKIDDALEDNQNAPTPLDELALQRLEKIKTDTERLIGRGKLENVKDELGNEFPSYRPWTQGEILEHANSVARDLKSFSYRDQNMAKTYPLRQFSKDITNDLHTNAYGDLSDDAVKALREADGLYAQYATAQKELKPVTSKAFDKVTGAKLKTLDDQVENIPEIGGALDKLAAVAGKDPMGDFLSPAMKEVKAREAVQRELLRRTKEKTVFDNLKPVQPGPIRDRLSRTPWIKELINDASPQNKIRAVHSAQREVDLGRKQLSKLDQMEIIKTMRGENPITAGYLKYLIDTPRAITRGVIQSIARQSGEKESDIEQKLKTLGIDVPQ